MSQGYWETEMTNDEVLKLDFAGWPLPDEFLTELGRIGALWGCLESTLNMCLRKLAGFNDLDDPTPFIIIVHTNFPQRLDMLGSLCEHLSPAYASLAGYQQTISALKNAQKLRNRFVHNSLAPGDGPGSVKMAAGSARGTLKFSTEKITIPDLRRVSMAIHEATLDLYRLVLKRDLPPIWDRTEGWNPCKPEAQ